MRPKRVGFSDFDFDIRLNSETRIESVLVSQFKRCQQPKVRKGQSSIKLRKGSKITSSTGLVGTQRWAETLPRTTLTGQTLSAFTFAGRFDFLLWRSSSSCTACMIDQISKYGRFLFSWSG